MMKTQLLQQMHGLWAIEPGAFQSFLASIQGGEQPAGGRGDGLRIENGAAIIKVDGVLLRDGPEWFDDYGIARMSAIGKKIRAAMNASEAQMIILDFDSPGGTVNGTEELAGVVAQAAESKFVLAYTAGMMASAAYWIGSHASAIYATPSSTVGSIGVIAAHVDYTAAREQMGVVVQVFRSGELKAPGAFNTSLTDQQAAHIQSQIDAMALKFYETVDRERPGKINAEHMDGRTFDGESAVAAGFVDGNVMSLDEILPTVQISY